MDIVIHEVFSVSATAEPGLYMIDIDFTDQWGQRDRVIYPSRQSDRFGANPVILAYLAAHPELMP